MKDPAMDDVEIICAVCRRKYAGKHVNNQWETVPICDWCALGMSMRDSGHTTSGGFWMMSGIIGQPETMRTEWVPERPIPPKPSEVN